MSIRVLRIVVTTAAGLVGAAAVWSICVPATHGPDVTVGDVWDLEQQTTAGPVDGRRAYTIGTDALNIGNTDLMWFSNTNQHPVIGGNLFRWKTDGARPAGRFEQLGLSWLKHGFYAKGNSNFCNCTFQPGHAEGDWLGHGCDDIYWADLNADQSELGPRSEVDAATGVFPYPFINQGTPDPNDPGLILFKRIQVQDSDMDPAANSGARYFSEAQYVMADDAAAANKNNNASYREITVDGARDIAFAGTSLGVTTQQQQPAIFAWKAVDPEVGESKIDVALDGRFWIATRVSDNGDGTWRYEYAIHNLNSDRSGQSFAVPIPSGATITNAGFHFVPYHSGEPYTNTPWTITVDNVGGTVTWATETFGTNPNANALRFATLDNFWFDADGAPCFANATLGLFKPGSPGSASTQVLAPVANAVFCDGFASDGVARWSAEVP